MHKSWRMKLQYIYMMFGAGNNQQVITRIKKNRKQKKTKNRYHRSFCLEVSVLLWLIPGSQPGRQTLVRFNYKNQESQQLPSIEKPMQSRGWWKMWHAQVKRRKQQTDHSPAKCLTAPEGVKCRIQYSSSILGVFFHPTTLLISSWFLQKYIYF